MTMWKGSLFAALLLISVAACERSPQVDYSFFVAGHTYGTPGAHNQGIHPPFLAEFPKLNNDDNVIFGVFTGDIVRKSDTLSWDSVDTQVSRLRMPVYFIPGNHDTYNRPLYEARYGKTYYSFTHGRDLFVFLDGNLSNWNIDGEQLDFLKNTLDSAAGGTAYAFIFIHQLVWWDEHNIFAGVHLNWPPYTPDTTNYWADIEPLLQGFAAPVVIFAGDLGANEQATPVMYYHDRNITYVASGMGSIRSDNYIMVTRHGDGRLSFDLIALSDDPKRMGKLEDHEIARP